MTKPTNIKLDTIVADAAQDLQMREQVDSSHVDDLKDYLDDLPPITVFQDEFKRYFIGDGWHRFLAHKLTNKKQILATIHEGGREAALKHALGANAEHNALRRTNRDKRKAVLIALKSHSAIFGAKKIKNVAVAEACKVAESFVRKIRKELESEAPKGSAGASRTAPEPEPQTDFFAQLNASFKPVEDGLKEVLNHTYFLNPDVLKKDKIEAINGIETALKARLQEAKDLRIKFTNQD